MKENSAWYFAEPDIASVAELNFFLFGTRTILAFAFVLRKPQLYTGCF